jgi:nucleoside-diphosphate-sugar epimerase
VQAFLSVLDAPAACIGEVFNIGSDVEVTTAEAIRTVEDIIGKQATFATAPRRTGDQLHTHANIDKARRGLGYSPRTSLADGLRSEIEWFIDSGAA